MIAGFAALLESPVPALEHAVTNVAIVLVDWIAAVVRIVTQFANAHVIATPPPISTVVSYDMTLIFFAARDRRRFVVKATQPQGSQLASIAVLGT